MFKNVSKNVLKKTRYISKSYEIMGFWRDIVDGVPTFIQYWFTVLCLLYIFIIIFELSKYIYI